MPNIPADLRRTAVVGVSVALLLVSAEAGGSRPLFYLALLLFTAVAAVWIRGQYDDWRQGDPPAYTWWEVASSGVILGLGLLCLLLAWMGVHIDGIVLAGLLATYFGLGSLVIAWRQADESVLPARLRPRCAIGVAMVAAGAVLAVIGIALLSSPVPFRWGVLVPLGLGLLILMPIGGQLLSEIVVDRLAEGPGPDVRATWAAVLGLVLVAVPLVVAYTWAGSGWPAVGLLLVAVLVVALVSSTRADIALVLAALAAMGLTPAQVSDDALRAEKGDDVLVVLGDSYMSGEGAATYYRGTDDAGRNNCRRAPSAWAAQAGQQPPFDGLVFLACSGARTANIRERQGSGPEPTPQDGEGVVQLARYKQLLADQKFRPKLVVLSVGGNDAGFSTIGLMCLAPGNCNDKLPTRLWTGKSLQRLGQLLGETYAEVDEVFKGIPVVVIPYPDPIADTERTCSQAALTTGDRRFLQQFVDELDTTIEEAARSVGFHYLGDMENALRDSGLQLCDEANNGRPGLNFIGLRSVSGLADQRFNPSNWSHNSLHPNELGHAAMFRVFEHWLADHPNLPARATPAPASSPTEPDAVVGADPPCDLFETDDTGCRPQGQIWVQQQVRAALLTGPGLLVLPVGLGAWLFAVVFFAWRKE